MGEWQEVFPSPIIEASHGFMGGVKGSFCLCKYLTCQCQRISNYLQVEFYWQKSIYEFFSFPSKKGGKKRKRFISHNSLVTKNFQFQIIGSTFI